MPSRLRRLSLSLMLSLPLASQALAQEIEIVQQDQLEAWTASIQKELEELRGQRFKRPVAVSTANLEQFIAYVKERMDKDTSAEDLRAQESVAKMLGVIPAEMDLVGTFMAMVEAQVGGFYDPSTESFCLMERFGGDLARIVLAHELTHALDDQYYDIDGTLAKIEKNGDASFAYHAVVEGSGTATQNAWIKSKVGEIDLKQLSASADIGTAGLEHAPPYLWKPLVGSYNLGASFLVRSSSFMAGQMKTPTAVDLHVAFRKPPRSSEQIIHPEKYWDEEQRDEPLEVRFVLAALHEGWSILAEDTLGEMGLGFVVEPMQKRKGMQSALQLMTTKYSLPASEGWGGDRYVLLGRGAARLLVLETLWDSPGDALEFKQAMLEQRELISKGLGTLSALAEVSQAPGFGLLQRSELGITVHLAIDVSEVEIASILGALLP